MDGKDEKVMFLVAGGFLLFSVFFLILVLGGIVSKLSLGETVAQRMIETSVFFVTALLFAVSGFGAFIYKRWARLGGVIAVLMGIACFVLYGIVYRSMNSFLITFIIIWIGFALFLFHPKVKEQFK